MIILPSIQFVDSCKIDIRIQSRTSSLKARYIIALLSYANRNICSITITPSLNCIE